MIIMITSHGHMHSLITGFTSMAILCRLPSCCVIVPPPKAAKVGFS